MGKWIKKVGSGTPLTVVARVIDSIAEITNDRINAPSIHAVREAINNNWLSVYPVGSIYMSVNEVDPSLVFGGTWQQIKDRFLLACGDTYSNGATGGEATHILTTDEIPSHRHDITYSVYDVGETGGQIETYAGSGYTRTTNATGGGAAHNNMPPYLAVNVWVRTA